MISKHRGMAIVRVLGVALALGACTAGDPDPHGDMPMEDMEMEGMGMEGREGMRMPAGMMRRHAQEADQMGDEMRRHIEQLRQLSPEQWHERMDEHARRVSRMLGLMSRHMREMDMGMGMSAEDMGARMGMTGDEHRRMVAQMQAVRDEVERLQTAPAAELGTRMPAHLQRLETLVTMLEESAKHMSAMEG